jgi:hypothetical protein
MEWQPIETAPKDGTWFLGFRVSPFAECQIQVWHWMKDILPEFQGWQNANDTCDFEEDWPTHWMPLPEPPK